MIFEQKNNKKHINMHNLRLIMLATNTIFTDYVRITLTKFHVEFQPHPLKVI